VLGKWTANRHPAWLGLRRCGRGAVLTSALEWFVLVPFVSILATDLHVCKQPYWIGFLCPSIIRVHVPAVRLASSLGLRTQGIRRQIIPRVGALAAIGGIVLLVRPAALLAAYDRELPWVRSDPAIDQTFIRHMTTLIISMELCWLQLPLKGLIIRIFAPSRSSWWRARRGRTKFFRIGGRAGSLNLCKFVLRKSAPRCPACSIAADIAKLRSMDISSFDQLFVDLMTEHHRERSRWRIRNFATGAILASG